MEFGLSPIPGFLFLCPFLRFGSARTQFPAAPNFFIFSPSSSGVSAALLFFFRTALFPSELFFFLPSCCLPSEVSGALLPFSFAFFPRLLSRAPSSCTPSSCTPSFLTPSSPHAFFSRLLSRALSFPCALFPARPLPRVPSFPCALFPRSLSRAPSSPRTLFPARLFFAPPFPCALFPVRSLSRALSFPRALFPARLFPRASFCTPSFRASRTFLPRLHSSRLEPSPQLEHSPTGTSAERNGSGWNGSKWGSNVCAIVFGASTGPSRAVYVTKLLNIFRILLKYLHNSKRPRIFAVKF